MTSFKEFMAEQEIDSILGNVSKQATPQQKSMFQNSQQTLKTAAQKYGPQMVQSAVQGTLNQMSGQTGQAGQAGQAGQLGQQAQMGQRPQNTQQKQFGQQSQMPQTQQVNPQQSKAFGDMLQQTLNNLSAQGAQRGMNAPGQGLQGNPISAQPGVA